MLSILHFDFSAPHYFCFGSAASRSRPAGGRCSSPVTYMKELAVCRPIRNTWYARICRDTTAARFLAKDKGKVIVPNLDPITPVLRFSKLFTSTEIFKLTSTYPIFLSKHSAVLHLSRPSSFNVRPCCFLPSPKDLLYGRYAVGKPIEASDDTLLHPSSL